MSHTDILEPAIIESGSGNRTSQAIKNAPLYPKQEWSAAAKILFRFTALYFLIQAVPLDWKYFRDVSQVNWLHLHYRDIFYIAHYSPRFFGTQPVLADWVVIAVTAAAGTLLWSFLDRSRKEYNALYYWLRVIVRYRLAIGLLAYGFLKFFPQQMPEVALSTLNTNYGDITDWKLFSISTGIVPGYEAFLGFVEILAALLLLNRRTVWLGAFMLIPFTGNVFLSNLAYEGGEYVYALGLIGFATYLLAYDVNRLLAVTTFEKTTEPDTYRPVFKGSSQTYRLALKATAILFFIVAYGFLTWKGQHADPYQYPRQAGLKDAAGFYKVAEFRVNGKVIPYSPNDPVRWKDVVFEKWNTLSIRSNQPVKIVTAGTEEIFLNDEDRNYEFAGIQGRHFYSYKIDSINHILALTNRNPNHAGDKLDLHFTRTGDNLLLDGIIGGDSLHVLLDRFDRKYLLDEAKKTGRSRGLKL